MMSVVMLNGANKPFMVSVIMVSVIMLSVVMLSVVMLSVVMLSVAMLSVTNKPFMLSYYAECRYAERRK
jgi:hypothetical protein